MAVDVPDRFDAGDAPAGVAVRPRVEADDRAIVAVMADAFDDPGLRARQEFLASKHSRNRCGSSPSTARAVGALFRYLANGRGRIGAIGVRAAWRRRGIASGLLRAAFEMFRPRRRRREAERRPEQRVRATRLYERAGMRLRRRWLVVAKTLDAAPDPPS
jgi:ribosomal protein S18 acetylase RimI-like enzyme